MGSHSVTCQQTEVRIPPLPPAEAGTRFTDPGVMQGWVEVQRFTTQPPRNTMVAWWQGYGVDPPKECS